MKADIGVIAGSGLYSLLEGAAENDIDTKYGKPSSKVGIGRIGKVDVAFIPRHGKEHTIPPHKVPYVANIQAFKDLGVTRIIGIGAVGSLREDYKPGDFVLFDQFINMTNGRRDTTFDEGKVVHVSTADPYCPEMRSVVADTMMTAEINMHKTGTVVVINGPRFSTKAESKLFASSGMDVINMTQYPEVALARELGICYVGIGVVTDYDAGIGGQEPVSFGEIANKFAESEQHVRALVKEIIPLIPKKQSCSCSRSLDGAVASKSVLE